MESVFPVASPSLEDLAQQLGALASAPRLALLQVLRTPCELHSLRIPAQNAARPLSRQTVTHHLGRLAEVGLVEHVGSGRRGEWYRVDSARLAAIIGGLRGVAHLPMEARGDVPHGMAPGPDQSLQPSAPPPAVVP